MIRKEFLCYLILTFWVSLLRGRFRIIWKNNGKTEFAQIKSSFSQPEVFPQIHFSYIFIIDDFIRLTARQHHTVTDDVGAVTNP